MKFTDRLQDKESAISDHMKVLQVNLGNRCNLACRHCHLHGGPDHSQAADKKVLEACIRAYQANDFQTMDITGGAPEMHPHFEWFLKEARKTCHHIIVRTNLAILQSAEYHHFLQLYVDNQVELIASLPCYTKENVDIWRGSGTYDASISSIKELNHLGYGKHPDLAIHFVYNPGGPFLPPLQEVLEADYKAILEKDHGIVFNRLLTITNMPIGRFREELESSGEYDAYLKLLKLSYNETAEKNIMCRSQISVGHDGTLYDCDFNQALGLPIENRTTIFDLAVRSNSRREIRFGDHCYGCTAGYGSSCGGATV